MAAAVAPHVHDKDRRYAVLVVDMLNDFVYGKIKCDRAVPMIPRSGELIDSARSAVPASSIRQVEVNRVNAGRTILLLGVLGGAIYAVARGLANLNFAGN